LAKSKQKPKDIAQYTNGNTHNGDVWTLKHIVWRMPNKFTPVSSGTVIDLDDIVLRGGDAMICDEND